MNVNGPFDCVWASFGNRLEVRDRAKICSLLELVTVTSRYEVTVTTPPFTIRGLGASFLN